MGPLLAQMRSADRDRKCLLFGVDRTYRRHVLDDANDPEQKSQTEKVRTSYTDTNLRTCSSAPLHPLSHRNGSHRVIRQMQQRCPAMTGDRLWPCGHRTNDARSLD